MNEEIKQFGRQEKEREIGTKMVLKDLVPIYKVEVGVLLSKDNDEFDSYDGVYDKKHAFYDENVAWFLDKEKAIDYAKQYCKGCVEHTYAIVSEFGVFIDGIEDWDEIAEEIERNGWFDGAEDFLGEECYDIHNVIECFYVNEKGVLIDDFFTKTEKEYTR